MDQTSAMKAASGELADFTLNLRAKHKLTFTETVHILAMCLGTFTTMMLKRRPARVDPGDEDGE